MDKDESALAPALDFVILGAQKSASTYLHRCLAEHPQVEMPSGESRHFEDPYYARGAPAELSALFGPRAESIRRGIKRPDYLARPAVAGRLAHHLPTARLLVVLREPIGRAVSAYFDYVRLGFAPLEHVDDAFEHLLDDSMQRRYPRVGDVLDYGLYGKHLSRYLGVFPRSQLLVLVQDEVVADPLRELGSVFRFLDVDDTFRPPGLRGRSNTSVYSPTRLRLLRARNRWQFSYAPDLSRREPRTASALGLAWV
ncbi:MAG: sulfotransferase, partial [Propionibacteriales bacterium]|nr:sulfotransferase [Propionibacteriales bacterium]